MNTRTEFAKTMSNEQRARMVLLMTYRLKDMLSGFPPEVQGAMLCDLTSIWLAGHAPHLRKAIYADHEQILWQLVEANEKIIFGEQGHPGKRDG